MGKQVEGRLGPEILMHHSLRRGPAPFGKRPVMMVLDYDGR